MGHILELFKVTFKQSLLIKYVEKQWEHILHRLEVPRLLEELNRTISMVGSENNMFEVIHSRLDEVEVSERKTIEKLLDSEPIKKMVVNRIVHKKNIHNLNSKIPSKKDSIANTTMQQNEQYGYEKLLVEKLIKDSSDLNLLIKENKYSENSLQNMQKDKCAAVMIANPSCNFNPEVGNHHIITQTHRKMSEHAEPHRRHFAGKLQQLIQQNIMNINKLNPLIIRHLQELVRALVNHGSTMQISRPLMVHSGIRSEELSPENGINVSKLLNSDKEMVSAEKETDVSKVSISPKKRINVPKFENILRLVPPANKINITEIECITNTVSTKNEINVSKPKSITKVAFPNKEIFGKEVSSKKEINVQKIITKVVCPDQEINVPLINSIKPSVTPSKGVNVPKIENIVKGVSPKKVIDTPKIEGNKETIFPVKGTNNISKIESIKKTISSGNRIKDTSNNNLHNLKEPIMGMETFTKKRTFYGIIPTNSWYRSFNEQVNSNNEVDKYEEFLYGLIKEKLRNKIDYLSKVIKYNTSKEELLSRNLTKLMDNINSDNDNLIKIIYIKQRANRLTRQIRLINCLKFGEIFTAVSAIEQLNCLNLQYLGNAEDCSKAKEKRQNLLKDLNEQLDKIKDVIKYDTYEVKDTIKHLHPAFHYKFETEQVAQYKKVIANITKESLKSFKNSVKSIDVLSSVIEKDYYKFKSSFAKALKAKKNNKIRPELEALSNCLNSSESRVFSIGATRSSPIIVRKSKTVISNSKRSKSQDIGTESSNPGFEKIKERTRIFDINSKVFEDTEKKIKLVQILEKLKEQLRNDKFQRDSFPSNYKDDGDATNSGKKARKFRGIQSSKYFPGYITFDMHIRFSNKKNKAVPKLMLGGWYS